MMPKLLKNHAAKMLGLIWMSLVSIVMLLEALGSKMDMTISTDNVILITATGSILFIVMLVIVRVLLSLLDDNRSHNSALDTLVIAVDEEGNVYLLPRDSTRVLKVRSGTTGASIQWTDALITDSMQSFKLITDKKGNFMVTDSSGERMEIKKVNSPVSSDVYKTAFMRVTH